MAALVWSERLITELVKGREMAIQLQAILNKHDSKNHGSSTASAQEITRNIVTCFDDSIYMLSTLESGEVCDDGGSEDSDASRKRSESSGNSRDGRGCYKRRKGAKTWTELSSTVEDGHAWRKYGQKDILNAKFPRCYFRCTHKNDQGCRATKQVQIMEDNPQMYHITYIGVHTCRRSNKLSPQIITETDPWDVIDGVKPQANNRTAVAAMKHEEDTPSEVTDNSFIKLDPIFDHGLGCIESIDMDEFMASCLGLDAGEYGFDGIYGNNGL